MPETTKIKMTADWIVKGQRWKKGKSYDAEPREREILLELGKAKVVTSTDKGA